MPFADLTLDDCQQAHADKSQALENSCGVFLVTRQSVERFGEPRVAASGAGISQ